MLDLVGWALQRNHGDAEHPGERPEARYAVVGHLGPDPDGSLLQARDATGGVVALRRVPPEARELVASQVEPLAALDSPHVVPVRELVEERGATWLVSDWVDGATLAEVVGSGATLVVGQRLGVVRGLLEGLAAAHEQGVVHGRVSPSSVLLGSDGLTRVTGFALGSPGRTYVAPEALSRPQAARTPAADVYAAAAVAVHLLTGRTVDQQSRELLALDTALRPPLARALAQRPTDRQRDAGVLLDELDAAAREAYGEHWWTEAGIGALVGPAVPDLTPLGPEGPTEPTASAARTEPTSRPEAPAPLRTRHRLRWVAAAVLGLLTVGAVVAGATAVIELNEDPPPDPVTLRTDLFCEEFGPAAQRAVGAGATTRFRSSGSEGGSGEDPTARASVSCQWADQSSATTATVSVGGEFEAGERSTAERLAGILDGASQAYVSERGGTWQDTWATRCTELDRNGYDSAFACLSPPITLTGSPVRPGTASIQLAFSTSGQSLSCGAARALRSAAEAASYDALVEDVEALCAEVLPVVRRGG